MDNRYIANNGFKQSITDVDIGNGENIKMISMFEDIVDSIIKIDPELIRKEELKTIKTSKELVQYIEDITSNSAVTSRLVDEMKRKNRLGNFNYDSIIPEGMTIDDYIDKSTKELDRVMDLVYNAVCVNAKLTGLAIYKANPMLINFTKSIVQSDSDIVKRSNKTDSLTYDFRKIGGGVVYIHDDVNDNTMLLHNSPKRLLIRSFIYDFIICNHGGTVNKKWHMYPIDINGIIFDKIKPAVDYLLELGDTFFDNTNRSHIKGETKILVSCCNEDGINPFKKDRYKYRNVNYPLSLVTIENNSIEAYKTYLYAKLKEVTEVKEGIVAFINNFIDYIINIDGYIVYDNSIKTKSIYKVKDINILTSVLDFIINMINMMLDCFTIKRGGKYVNAVVRLSEVAWGYDKTNITDGYGYISENACIDDIYKRNYYNHTNRKYEIFTSKDIFNRKRYSLMDICNTVKEMNNMKSYNEVIGGMPPAHCHTDYIVPVMMCGPTFTDRSNIIFGNTGSDKMIKFDSMMEPEELDKDDVLESISDCHRLITNSNILPSLSIKKLKSIGEDGLIELMTNRPYTGWKDLILEKVVQVSDDIDNDFVRELKLNGLVQNVVMALNEKAINEGFITSDGYVTILKDGEGFYAETPQDYHLVSKHYTTYEDIPKSIIDMMNNMYKAYKKKEEL